MLKYFGVSCLILHILLNQTAVFVFRNFILVFFVKGKGKPDPLQARRGPEGSRKLKFPDFVTAAQNGGRLSALRTGRLYPQEIPLIFMLEADSTPGP